MIGILADTRTNTFEGVLLLIIAVAALLFAHPTKHTDRASMLLSAFFVCMSLLGLARILDGTIAGSLFGLLQDALVLLGGLFLVQFAYHFPSADSPREARAALVVYSLLAILSFGTIIFLAIAAFRHPAGYIEIPEYYWYLMPLAIVLAIGFYVRRSLFHASLPDVSSVGRRPHIFDPCER